MSTTRTQNTLSAPVGSGSTATLRMSASKPNPHSEEQELYSFVEPSERLPFSSHFSSLLLSADKLNTAIEMGALGGLSLTAVLYPSLSVPGSMSLGQLAAFMWACALLRRLYNAYLEAVFFACPTRRTQPVKEHALKSERDLCGRDREQLASLVMHDRLTLISQLGLVMALYFGVPGFYPAFKPSDESAFAALPLAMRAARLIAHHYLLSFGMYWAHRSLHVVPILWRRIHSIHHWAKHPLSRNTYQDHWLDNFANALVGEVAAQILIPLDFHSFWISRLLRIMESLEKHAGVCGATNLAHTAQRWLPFAQMPHHHDWHHEGHKSCNFTFAAIGGIWDCVFGTRKAGRAMRFPEASTARDHAEAANTKRGSSFLGSIDNPAVVLSPVLTVLALAAARLISNGFHIA